LVTLGSAFATAFLGSAFLGAGFETGAGAGAGVGSTGDGELKRFFNQLNIPIL
jgi:hypothetical protein